MGAKVTLEEIQELGRMMAAFHATHARQYGPQASCTEATCVEGKDAIAWLIDRVLSHELEIAELEREIHELQSLLRLLRSDAVH
jgi:hypothetical protein